MSEDCVFCGIIEENIPSHKVYETDEVVAFLDANPVTRGHTLVVPKRHVEDIHGTSDMSYMYDAVVKVADAVKSAFEPEGVQITQNNGEAAGQEVFHMHFHVTPVYSSEDIQVEVDREELEDPEEVKEAISGNIERD